MGKDDIERRMMRMLTGWGKRPDSNALAEKWDQARTNMRTWMSGHCYDASKQGIDGRRVGSFANKIKSYALDHPLDIVFVDYAQVIKADRDHRSNVDAQNEISDALFDLAGELDIPVVVGSQVTVDQDGRVVTKDSRCWVEDSALTCYVEWQTMNKKGDETWRVDRPDSGLAARLRLGHGRFNQADSDPIYWDPEHLAWILTGRDAQVWE